MVVNLKCRIFAINKSTFSLSQMSRAKLAYAMPWRENATEEDIIMIINIANPIYAAKLRQDMNVEDEYFSAIENRDTAIMQRDKKIEEQEAQIEANKAQLEEQEAQLKEQEAQLEEKEAQLEEQRNALKASVKIMKEAGVPIEQIASLTKLSKEEIQSL